MSFIGHLFSSGGFRLYLLMPPGSAKRRAKERERVCGQRSLYQTLREKSLPIAGGGLRDKTRGLNRAADYHIITVISGVKAVLLCKSLVMAHMWGLRQRGDLIGCADVDQSL